MVFPQPGQQLSLPSVSNKLEGGDEYRENKVYVQGVCGAEVAVRGNGMGQKRGSKEHDGLTNARM